MSLTVIPLAVGVSNQGWLKTFKDLTLNFQHATLIGITFENKQRLLLATAANFIIMNSFWQYYYWIIFCWDILLLIIFRLMAIFLWVIGGEYFGERDFVANYDFISRSHCWWADSLLCPRLKKPHKFQRLHHHHR